VPPAIKNLLPKILPHPEPIRTKFLVLEEPSPRAVKGGFIKRVKEGKLYYTMNAESEWKI